LVSKIDIYGNGYKVRCQNLEDICEREIEMIEENEKEVQREQLVINPTKENYQITKSQDYVSTLNLQLHSRLTFSNNFLKCTEGFATYYYNSRNRRADNELCRISFVMVDPAARELMVITQQ
jgi:hypothetical protein